MIVQIKWKDLADSIVALCPTEEDKIIFRVHKKALLIKSNKGTRHVKDVVVISSGPQSRPLLGRTLLFRLCDTQDREYIRLEYIQGELIITGTGENVSYS